jgi:hypothetical protein
MELSPVYDVEVARVRFAVPCSARRTNGEACKNYAMAGATVCHAHGGRAPQVRAAAEYRLMMAKVSVYLAKLEAEKEAERAALSPWAPELQHLALVKHFDPSAVAERYRQIARVMTSVARTLRAKAKELDEAAAAKPSR